MIALESVQKFKLRDLAIIGLSATLFALLQFAFQFLDARWGYYALLLCFALLISFATLFIRKAGTATMVAGLSALLSFGNGILIATGWNKVITFTLAGLLFEFLFLMLKLEIHFLPLDIIVGTALAAASVPLSTLFLLSTELAAQNGRAVLNILLLSFSIGLIGAVLAFLIWFQIKHTKLVLQYEYGT